MLKYKYYHTPTPQENQRLSSQLEATERKLKVYNAFAVSSPSEGGGGGGSDGRRRRSKPGEIKSSVSISQRSAEAEAEEANLKANATSTERGDGLTDLQRIRRLQHGVQAWGAGEDGGGAIAGPGHGDEATDGWSAVAGALGRLQEEERDARWDESKGGG
jgi:hypothetical protein